MHSSGVGHYSRNELFEGILCGTRQPRYYISFYIFQTLIFCIQRIDHTKCCQYQGNPERRSSQKLIIISWFVWFCGEFLFVFLSKRGRAQNDILFNILNISGFFFSFALTICPFQARKRKTRRVGNQIDGETHMRNLKLKTHKISTDILSCTNYWQLKDERGISAHTKKKKNKGKDFQDRFAILSPFFRSTIVFGLAFFFLCPSDVYMYVHTIYIYIYMHIKRQLVVIKLYTKAVESFLFRWCHCRFFIFGIASFCKTVRFVRLDAELMMQWQLMHTTQSAFSIYDIYAQLVSLFAVWRFSWRSIPRSPPIFPLIW